MNAVESLIEWIDKVIIFPLPALILSLMLIRRIYKDRFPVVQAFNCVKWFMISYTIVTLLFFVLWGFVEPDNVAFLHRATGPYAWAYWIMLAASLTPFTLLFRKVSQTGIELLVISLLIKVGAYFERLVLLTMSFHRDYPGTDTVVEPSALFGLLFTLLRGFGLAVLLLVIIQLILNKKRN